MHFIFGCLKQHIVCFIGKYHSNLSFHLLPSGGDNPQVIAPAGCVHWSLDKILVESAE